MDNPPLGIILQKESYLAMIRNAIGANLFRNLYATVDGEKKDILKDGQLSCASFVSSILYLLYLIKTPHTTVAGLERDLVGSGWKKTDAPHPGDILVWEPSLQADEVNAHVGFFIGGDRAISNSWQTRTPTEHHVTFGTNADRSPARAITTVYTHDLLS